MSEARAIGRLVSGGLVLLFGFTALYVAAFHAPRPHGVDVGVVGTPQHAQRLRAALDDRAFDVERFATDRSAREALLDTDVSAVLVPRAGHGRILVATALGPVPTAAVTGALRHAAAGMGATSDVEDLRPLPQGDSRGLTSLFTVVGTLIPSLVFGVLVSVFGRGLPARVRWGAMVTYAAGAGLLAAFNADVLVGAFDDQFLGIAAVAGLLALAVAAAAHGLGHLCGPAGIVTAILVLLLLGVSSAGGAVTYRFEPAFFGAVSQLLPPGAALTAVRNVEYFDWAATLGPLLVLGAWAAGGLAFGLAGERFGPHVRNTRKGRFA
jgi:hypothetical protein